MENRAWQEKEEFGFSFPFRCWDSALPDFVYPAHWHEYYEIMQVLRGRAEVVLDGAACAACDGDIVLMYPGQVHSFPATAAGTCLRFFHFEQRIFSNDDHLLELIENGKGFSRQPVLRAAPGGASGDLHQRIRGILEDIFGEYSRKAKGWRLAVRAGLYLLMLARVRDEAASEPGAFERKPFNISADERMERVYLFINKRFSDPTLNLDQAAREAALSRFHFARVFKQRTGQTFHGFLSAVRLSHARELLLKTDLPVMEVARNCGFTNLPSFFRVFKAGTGFSPGKYRSQAGR